jgi:alpha-L-fucosidase
MLCAMPLAAAMLAVEPPEPLPPLPSPQQLAWSELETYAFVHFGPNTFTNVEWGEGRETPQVFNPTQLDCRQWAALCKDAGLKAIIITAKHHDGFCLWPSRYTEHSVKSSPWRDGKGDVLRELSNACREFGLQFGVYLSPWDRNNPLYGEGQPYNDYFASQLREVLTGYGEVFEVWFDGACGEGPNGRRQQYDWPLFIRTVRDCQPNAVIFSDAGPDVRWVGNENGYAGETNWSMLKRDAFYPGIPDRNKQLNEGDVAGTHWLPAECDVSIRPGWFYHPEQDDKVKSVDDLVNIYLGSVGRNGNLLLNLPVDRRGLVHEVEGTRLKDWRARLDAMFAYDLARGSHASASASNVRGNDASFAAGNVHDGDAATYWACDQGTTSAWVQIAFHQAQPIDTVLLQEPIAMGQRVKAFAVDVMDASEQWREIAQGTTIGHKRILRFDPVTAQVLRVRILDSRAAPLISTVGAYAVHRQQGTLR